MSRTHPSLAVALLASALVSGCFALFSLDDYGPNRGGGDGDGGPNVDASFDADGGGDAALDAPKGPRVLFVTSGRFNGSMGGLSGADNRCNAAAADAGLQGSFVAWLGQGTSNGPASRISDPQRAIVFPNDAAVAGSLAELAATGPRERILVTETGTAIAANGCVDDHVWTNAKADGTVQDGGFDCNSWSGVTSGGGAGQLGGAHDEWTDGCNARACDNPGHLYCFQK